MTTCSYCIKEIEEVSYKKYVRKSKKKKKTGAIIPYHWKCWNRKMNVGKRRDWNVRHPLGGFR